MFCPQCGQQQVSSEVRFCSRCGFQLAVVTSLLSTGGLPTSYAPEVGEQQPSPKRKGVMQGVAMLLIGMVLTPLFAILSEFTGLPEMLIPLSAIVFFWGGILRMLWAAVFLKGAPRQLPQPDVRFAYVPPSAPQQFSNQVRGGDSSSLPAAQNSPPSRSSYVPPPPRRSRTEELVSPPSVTEQATQLLDEDRDPRAR